jgi:parallel beta-helix repeat protein
MACRFAIPAAFLALPLISVGCGDYPALPDVIVHSGQSIQQALDQMPASVDNWLIKVRPGVYKETLSVDRLGVTLMGEVTGTGPEDRPVLDGSLDGGKLRKDAVIVSGPHFTMSGFTVRSYSGNGVTTTKTHHLTLRDLQMDNTGRYGLYPVESEDILIEDCVASHISDAGIYVGQSKRATVRRNKVFANVAGLEIENTVEALVEENEAYDNTTGLLAFVLPNNPSKVGKDCTFRNNKIHDNNHVNFGDPTAIVSKLSPGIGVFIMAADNTVVQNNDIRNNNSLGLGIVGLGLLLGDTKGLDVEPNSDTTQVRNNTYTSNGKQPDAIYKSFGFPGGDILWDGTGAGNCIDESQDDTLVKVAVAVALPRCK